MPGTKICIYCDKRMKAGYRGDHVFPESLGGGLALLDRTDYQVCSDCNGGVLGQLDDELATKSFVAQVTCQLKNSYLWQSWNIDPAKNLMFEAEQQFDKETGELMTMRAYPQIIFAEKPEIIVDIQEGEAFGLQRAAAVLLEGARKCYERHLVKAKKGKLNPERIRTDAVQGTLYPPRMFARTTIMEMEKNIDQQSFQLRFTKQEEMQYVLSWLPRLPRPEEYMNFRTSEGSPSPRTAHYFDMGKVVRALMKIGLNAIMVFCPNTRVSKQTFTEPFLLLPAARPMNPFWCRAL
jgi:hypothetical protein